jgi:hypothetical protein
VVSFKFVDFDFFWGGAKPPINPSLSASENIYGLSRYLASKDATPTTLYKRYSA